MQKLVEKKKVFNNARVKENLNENSYASARGKKQMQGFIRYFTNFKTKFFL